MNVDCPPLEIINHPEHHWCADEYQTYHKTSCRCANACGPEAKFLAQLNCNEICRALFPGELFLQDITLEQFIHTGSNAAWPQSELPPARSADTTRGIIVLEKPCGGHSGPQYSKHISILYRKHWTIFPQPAQSSELKWRKICCGLNTVNFHFTWKRLRHPELTQHAMKVTYQVKEIK